MLDVLPLPVFAALLLRVDQLRLFHLVDESHRFIEVLRDAQLAQRVQQLVHLVHVRPRHEFGQQVGLEQGAAQEAVLPAADEIVEAPDRVVERVTVMRLSERIDRVGPHRAKTVGDQLRMAFAFARGDGEGAAYGSSLPEALF